MNPNELLLWLSAKGEGTWSRFRTAIDELAASDGDDNFDDDTGEDVSSSGSLPQYLRIKLNLERLGHAEFRRPEFPNGWRVVPPTIVVMPANDKVHGLLCGARTDKLMVNLREMVGADNFHVSSQDECPNRVVVAAATQSELSDIANETQFLYQEGTIERLLSATPSVDNSQLRSNVELPFGQDWQAKRFSASKLTWVDSSIEEARSRKFGLFQIHVRYRHEYFMKLHGYSYKLPVQVGKYIVLKQAHRKVTQYDFGRRVFSVPLSCRPPLLLDRALTLCSGQIPGIVDGHLEYLDIAPRHWRAAKRILRQ